VRPCCTVDPIENEEDRSKAIANVNTLLEKADIEYKKVIQLKNAYLFYLERL
jgi:E3 ubiquitin-protein ligase UBR4